MRTNEGYEKEISPLIRAIADAARRFASLEWTTFCTGPTAYETKLAGHTTEYRLFAQQIFQEGFHSGYVLYSYGWPAFENVEELLHESWSENDFNNMEGEYIGNPDSPLSADTVPEEEARELFRLGFKQALMLLVEIKTANPYK